MKSSGSTFTLWIVIIFSLFLVSRLSADITTLLNLENYSGDFMPNSMKVLRPVAVTEPLSIDGLIDSAWFAMTPFGNFTEFQPFENRRPSVVTAGYVTYDPGNLYIAFVCQDPDMSLLRASLTDRDNIYDDDWVCVSIDPDNDQQKAFEFYVNALGIQGDRLWQSNGNEDESFDLVWQADAVTFEGYWTAEIKIPFESLRFPDQEIQNWRVHFIRHYPREESYRYSWMPISENNNSFMGQGGILEFQLSRVKSERQSLEILPYVISNQESHRIENSAEGGIGDWKWTDPEARAGFGVKYSLSSNLIADFTYNPDFSQIESDAGQININYPLALFYDERRPFFQEGNDIYVIDQNSSAGVAIDQYVNLFYSRSINDPQLAGKISGRYGRMSFGLTTANDQSTPFLIPTEERTAVLATSRTSFTNALRMKYDLGNRSSVGLILTDRRLEDDGSNSVAAVDATVRLSEKYNFSLITALTHTRELNDPELSSPLGNASFETSDGRKTVAFDGETFYGTLTRAKINRDSRHWVATLAYQDFSPGFRADNGFITTNSYRMAEYISAYSFRFEEHPVFNFIRPRISVWRKFNYDGVVKDTGLRSSVVVAFKQQTLMQIGGFLFNRENLYGKQFGDARLVWLHIENRTLNAVSGFMNMRIGREINRLGVMNDPRNPFEIVPSLNYSIGLTFKPMAQLTDLVSYDDFTLWTDFGGQKIRGQKILRNSLSYQFSKNMAVRLITEYNVVDYYSSALTQMVNQKYFSFEPLFSYKFNAFSVFYLGGHIGAQNNFYLDWEDVRVNNQSLFLKFQYLIRS